MSDLLNMREQRLELKHKHDDGTASAQIRRRFGGKSELHEQCVSLLFSPSVQTAEGVQRLSLQRTSATSYQALRVPNVDDLQHLRGEMLICLMSGGTLY